MIIELTGLDGSNPMGFLAALGALAAGDPSWKLGWRNDGTWSAYLEGPESREALIDLLQHDRDQWGEESLLTELEQPDIKMPRSEFRENAKRLIGRSSASWLGVLGNELAQDGSGKNIKPSALHFTAGQQKFLSTVREIREAARVARPSAVQLEDALFDRWKRRDDVKSLSWDASVSRDYALRFKNPSIDKKLTEAGAEWLAFRSLITMPSAPKYGKLQTACVGGSWKHGWFRWPLWSEAATLHAVKALLRQPKLAGLTRAQAAERGLFSVFTSRIHRSDQGGYGSFAPSRPAVAADDPT